MSRLLLVIFMALSSISCFAGLRSLPLLVSSILAQPQPAVGEPKVAKTLTLTAGLKQQLIDESEVYVHVVNAIEFRTNRLVNVVKERFQAMLSLLPEQERPKHAKKNDTAISSVTSIMAVDMHADAYIQNALFPLLSSLAPLLALEKVNPNGDQIRRVLHGPDFITMLYLKYDFDDALLDKGDKLAEELAKLEEALAEKSTDTFLPLGKGSEKEDQRARLVKVTEEMAKVKKALFSIPGKVMSAHRLNLVLVPQAAKKVAEGQDDHTHEDPKLVQDLTFERMETDFYAPLGRPAP